MINQDLVSVDRIHPLARGTMFHIIMDHEKLHEEDAEKDNVLVSTADVQEETAVEGPDVMITAASRAAVNMDVVDADTVTATAADVANDVMRLAVVHESTITSSEDTDAAMTAAAAAAYTNDTTANASNDTTTNKNTNDTTRRNKRHGARNQHRHKFFVKWILETFPQAIEKAKDHAHAGGGGGAAADHMNMSGCHHPGHILDIAGGKGELSARLTLCHSLFVRMIDPRPANVYDCFYKNVYRSLPKKWQQRVDQNDNYNHKNIHTEDHPSTTTTKTTATTATATTNLSKILQYRFHQYEKPFPLDSAGSSSEDIIDQLKKDKDLWEAVEHSTLLIGMHADGATEAIVDVALYFRKPFVVVPCCVFPNLFRNRYVPSSMNSDSVDKSLDHHQVPVRNHEQFCKYLALKDSHFVMETLPFEGRNIGIWWDGKKRDGDDDEDDIHDDTS